MYGSQISDTKSLIFIKIAYLAAKQWIATKQAIFYDWNLRVQDKKIQITINLTRSIDILITFVFSLLFYKNHNDNFNLYNVYLSLNKI